MPIWTKNIPARSQWQYRQYTFVLKFTFSSIFPERKRGKEKVELKAKIMGELVAEEEDLKRAVEVHLLLLYYIWNTIKIESCLEVSLNSNLTTPIM